MAQGSTHTVSLSLGYTYFFALMTSNVFGQVQTRSRHRLLNLLGLESLGVSRVAEPYFTVHRIQYNATVYSLLTSLDNTISIIIELRSMRHAEGAASLCASAASTEEDRGLIQPQVQFEGPKKTTE
jgi:hypothetical protein